ncbi:hypothetical protein [Streptacidiphilus rugosus]|nr:hypothetical protein [Streptacidiphilus rugosus]
MPDWTEAERVVPTAGAGPRSVWRAGLDTAILATDYQRIMEIVVDQR